MPDLVISRDVDEQEEQSRWASYVFITPVRSTLQKSHGDDSDADDGMLRTIRMSRVCLVVHVLHLNADTHLFVALCAGWEIHACRRAIYGV